MKKNIVIIATGGTIAGESNSKGYDSGVLTVERLLESVPQLSGLAEFEAIQFCNIGSQDMDFSTLQKLVQLIQEKCDRTEIDGVVVIHGTDTMEESTFFCDLVIDTDKPIVFTGSMRPNSSLSADGPLNIYNAVLAASSEQLHGYGVVVCLNGEIHSARTVLKSHTTSVGTFISPVSGVIATIVGNALFCQSKYRRLRSPFIRSQLQDLIPFPRVDIFYGYTAMNEDLIEYSVSQGAKGIILAGMGNGNVNKSVVDCCVRLAAAGICVVRASRVANGPVVRNLEIDDSLCGFVVSGNLSPQKARVLVMIALQTGVSMNEIQKLFYELG